MAVEWGPGQGTVSPDALFRDVRLTKYLLQTTCTYELHAYLLGMQKVDNSFERLSIRMWIKVGVKVMKINVPQTTNTELLKQKNRCKLPQIKGDNYINQ